MQGVVAGVPDLPDAAPGSLGGGRLNANLKQAFESPPEIGANEDVTSSTIFPGGHPQGYATIAAKYATSQSLCGFTPSLKNIILRSRNVCGYLAAHSFNHQLCSTTHEFFPPSSLGY